MDAYDDMFKKFFDQSQIPNPFDPESIGRFVQEQIKHAMQGNEDAMSQYGQNPFQNGNANGMNQGNPTNNASNAGQGYPNYMPGQKRTTSGYGHSASGQSQANQDPSGNQGGQALKHQAFETNDDIIVRVQIPEDFDLRPENLQLTSHQLTFNNEEHTKPLLQINLPKPVDPKQTRAGFQQGILEIKLPKKMDEPVTEINISDLFRPSNNT